jgi:hypothetical protein
MRIPISKQLLHRVLGVGVGSCLLTLSIGVGPAAADEQDPMTVVQTYVRALDSGDAAAAAAVFADNAIHIHPIAAGACSRQSPCIGRRAILDDLRNRTADHQCITLLDGAVTGSIVRGTAELRNDALRSIGIERMVVSSTWLVTDGRALALYVLPDLTDPQTAASAAIGAGLQEPGAPIQNASTGCG